VNREIPRHDRDAEPRSCHALGLAVARHRVRDRTDHRLGTLDVIDIVIDDDPRVRLGAIAFRCT
jgi:hypothetical protein